MRRRIARVSVAVLAGIAMFGTSAPKASAHPTDELLQQMYVTPTATGAAIEVDLTPGVLIGTGFVALLDTDANGTMSTEEGQSFASEFAKALAVSVDGIPTPPRVISSEYPDAAILAAGGGPIKIELTVTPAAGVSPASAGEHTVSVTDTYAPMRTVVQGAVDLPSDRTIEVGAIEHPDQGRTLTVHYRTSAGPTTTPAAATQATTASPGTVPVAIKSAGAPSTRTAGSAPVVGAPARSTYLFDALRRPLGSPGGLVTLLVASMLLGALHALTPGHGKTLLAAYLVGDRGTPRQAVALGTAVTVTHTASVIGIGTAVLIAGRYVVPGVLVPALEAASGVLVVVLGARLLRRNLRRRRTPAWLGDHDHSLGHKYSLGHDRVHVSAHAHSHDHHSHDHDLASTGNHEYGHSHDGHSHDGHSHAVPESLGFRSLITMGVSGGIVPCPEALGVLLLAVGVHRTALGIGMIVAFSVGLALVLVGLGLVLVSARSSGWMRRRGDMGPRLQRLIPIGSAIVVTALGVALTMRGISSLASR